VVPFLLYVITGLATGAQVYWLLMWGVWGRPSHPLQYVSLIASLALILASFLSLYRSRQAAWLALVATLAIWVFFGPAAVVTLKQLLTSARVFRPLVFLPPVLLLATTSYAVMAGPLRHNMDWAPTWLFPDAASRGTKLAVELLVFLVALGVVVGQVFFVGVEKTQTQEMRWSYGEGRNARGQREILLTYLKNSHYYERFYSNDLAHYLESSGSEVIPVRFVVTYDFGRVRAISIRSVGQWARGRAGWAGGGSGCGGKLPPCVGGGAGRGRSPWDR
jgi:hypothetical protein